MSFPNVVRLFLLSILKYKRLVGINLLYVGILTVLRCRLNLEKIFRRCMLFDYDPIA